MNKNKKIQSVLVYMLIGIICFPVILCNSLLKSSNAVDVLEYEIKVSQPKMSKIVIEHDKIKSIFDRVALDGYYNNGGPGEPLLPYKNFKIALPQNCDAEKVEVISFTKAQIKGKFNIEPSQAGDKIDDIGIIYHPPLDSIYKSNNPYPTSNVNLVGTFVFRGYSSASVSICPLIFTPKDSSLSYYSKIRIRITTKSAKKGYNKTFRNKNKDLVLAKSRVINPSMFDKYISQIPITINSFNSILPTSVPLPPGNWDMVIAASSSECSGSLWAKFNNYAVWRTSTGVKTTTFDTDTLQSTGYTGSWPEMLRSFITDAYQQRGIEYVLLGGDIDWYQTCGGRIPNIEFNNNFQNEPPIVTNIMFACLDGVWNNDGDSLYGEIESPPYPYDFDADVFVGAVPADYACQIDNFTNKMKKYVTGDISSYRCNALELTGRNCGSSSANTADYIKNKLSTSFGMTNTNIIVTTTPQNTAVMTALGSNPPHILFNYSHGVSDNGQWQAGAWDYLLSRDDLPAMSYDKPFLVYSCSCSGIRYNYGEPDTPGCTNNMHCENMGEMMVTGDHGCPSSYSICSLNKKGAFAYIGNTDYGLIGYSDIYAKSFFDEITSPYNANKCIGDSFYATFLSASSIPQVYWYDLNYNMNILGDPSTVLRTCPPVQLLIKDNPNDYGFTPSSSPFWISPDVIVDAPDASGLYAPGTVCPSGNCTVVPSSSDSPKSGKTNHVFIRVWNQSCLAATNVIVRLYYADPTTFGAYPNGWIPITYQGVTGGIVGNTNKVVSISWITPQSVIGHWCLLATVECTQDPLQNHTVNLERKVSQKNVNVLAGPWLPGNNSSDLYFYINTLQVSKNDKRYLTVVYENMPSNSSMEITIPKKNLLLDYTKDSRVKVKGDQYIITMDVKKNQVLPNFTCTAKTLVKINVKFKSPFKKEFAIVFKESLNDKTLGGYNWHFKP